MAVLSDPNREATWADYMRDDANQPCPVTKADLRAALNAADQWREDNAASFNAALPQPFRGAATAKQKAALLLYVIRKHYEVT